MNRDYTLFLKDSILAMESIQQFVGDKNIDELSGMTWLPAQ